MECINLPASLILVWDLRRSIEVNQSLKVGLFKFRERKLKCGFAKKINVWVDQVRHGQKIELEVTSMNIHQRMVVELMQKGLAGLSIYESLVELDSHLISCCEDDIEKHVSMLPLVLQIPLLGLLFPAILMLLIIPAVKMLNI